MAVKVNVHVSRKLTEDFNSRGYALNVEAELPNDIVSDPAALASATNDLFRLAGDMLDEQISQTSGGVPAHRPTPANGSGNTASIPAGQPRQSARPHYQNRANFRVPDNGGNGRDHSYSGPRPITQAQTKAILNMSIRANQNADEWARKEFGLGLRELSIKQGSQLIDMLKKEIEVVQAERGGQ